MRKIKGCFGALVVLAIVFVAIYANPFTKSISTPATATPDGWYDAQRIRTSIEAALLVKASHLNVTNIKFEDTDGQRAVVLTYTPVNNTMDAVTDDLITLYAAAELGVRNTVAFDIVHVYVEDNGKVLPAISAKMSDIVRFVDGKMSRQTFASLFVFAPLVVIPS